MKKWLTVLSVLFALGSQASEHDVIGDTGLIQIQRIGCNIPNDICYISIDRKVGPVSCKSSSIRWRQSDVNGKAALSLLSSAFQANKRVSLNISGTCLDSNYPTFTFFAVHKN